MDACYSGVMHDTLSVTPKRVQSLLWPSLYTPLSSLEAWCEYGYEEKPYPLSSPYQGDQRGVITVGGRGIHSADKWHTQGQGLYQRGEHRNVNGSLQAFPGLFYPYLLSNEFSRNERFETYHLEGSFGFTHHRVTLGAGGKYFGTTHYSRIDPRPRGRVSDLTIEMAAGVDIEWYFLALNGSYRRYHEPLHISIEEPERKEMIYHELGFGLYDHYISEVSDNDAIELFHTEWKGSVQIAPLRQNLPLLWGEYTNGSSFGRTHELAQTYRRNSHSITAGLELPLRFGEWQINPSVAFRSDRIVGNEILYQTIVIHENPTIHEMHEYARLPKWNERRCEGTASALAQRRGEWGWWYVGYAATGRTLSARYSTPGHSLQHTSLRHGATAGTTLLWSKFSLSLRIMGERQQAIRQSRNLPPVTDTPTRLATQHIDFLTHTGWRLSAECKAGYKVTDEQTVGISLRQRTIKADGASGVGIAIEGAVWYRMGN